VRFETKCAITLCYAENFSQAGTTNDVISLAHRHHEH